VKGAAVINRIVTVAKLVPILVFIFLVLFARPTGVRRQPPRRS
jgi:amino acid transporter